MKRLPPALAVLLLLATPAAAQDVRTGFEAYLRGDYAAALHAWRPLADQGEAAAQSHLGNLHREGRGVAQDDGEAVKWYRKAADQGYGDAQNNLGQMYALGRGAPQNDAEAVAWYRKAADHGHAIAQANLGFMYTNGRGVPQDLVQAHKWFNLAAAQGNKTAVKNQDIIAKLLTSAQIAEARKLARAWKAKPQ